MTEYEVNNHETQAWYKGYIHDYDENKKQFFVMYDKNWKNPHYVDPQDIRPPADEAPSNWKPSLNEICECKAQADISEPFGWWPCQVKSIKNNNIIISYLGFENLDQTVDKNIIRPSNKKKPLSSRNMTKKSIDIPSGLLSWIQSNPKEITDLRSRLVHMKIENSQLVLIGNEKSLHLAEGIVKLHFQKQKDLKDLESKAQLEEAKLEEQKQKEGNAVKRSFPIHPLLIGFLLGRNKKYTLQIKQELPDIVYIRPKNGVCEIAAATHQTLDEACERLEIAVRKVAIPKEEMGFIIGLEGRTINKIKDRIGTDVHIISWEKFPGYLDNLKKHYEERLNNRKKPDSKQNKQQQANDVNEFLDEDNVFDVKNTQVEDMFSANDHVDLTNGILDDNAKDFLVFFGRRSRVELCITMIELTLDLLRKSQQHKDRIKDLKDKIKVLKGDEIAKPANPNQTNRNASKQKPQNQQNIKQERNKKTKFEKQQPSENTNQSTKKGDKKNKKNTSKPKQNNEETVVATGEEQEEQQEQQEETNVSKKKKNQNEIEKTADNVNDENENEENDDANNENQKKNKKHKKKKRKTKKNANNEDNENDEDK